MRITRLGQRSAVRNAARDQVDAISCKEKDQQLIPFIRIKHHACTHLRRIVLPRLLTSLNLAGWCNSKARSVTPAFRRGVVGDLVDIGHFACLSMGGVSGIEPRRLALRYAPPGIIVEYVYHAKPTTALSSTRQLYHHEINLEKALSMPRATAISDERLAELVRNLIIQHAEVLGDSKVSSNQLVRLIKKLAAHHLDTQTPLPPATAAPVLPQADYNRVSETQLKVVKQKMDLVFEQNLLRPGQDGFQYDKQVAFQPAIETSDWDDE